MCFSNVRSRNERKKTIGELYSREMGVQTHSEPKEGSKVKSTKKIVSSSPIKWHKQYQALLRKEEEKVSIVCMAVQHLHW